MALIEGMAANSQQRNHLQQPGTLVITADASNSTQQGSISTLTAEAQFDNRQRNRDNTNTTVPNATVNQAAYDEDRSATTQETAQQGILDAWSSELVSASSGSRTHASGNELANLQSPAMTRFRDTFQVINPKQTKKQKSVHDAKVALTIVANLGDTGAIGQSPVPAETTEAIEHSSLQDIPLEETQPPRTETPTSIQAAQEFEDDEFSDDAMEFEDGDDASSMNTSTATANTDLDDQYNTNNDPDGGDFG